MSRIARDAGGVSAVLTQCTTEVVVQRCSAQGDGRASQGGHLDVTGLFICGLFGRDGDISETRPIVPRLAETRARSDPPRISAIRLVLAASLIGSSLV